MDIRSKSDSVVPGYLYQKLGDTNEIWNLLDGIFACIIYDGRYVLLHTHVPHSTGDIIAARDPIGICSLYWGKGLDGSVWFASEMKALQEHCETFELFPPVRATLPCPTCRGVREATDIGFSFLLAWCHACRPMATNTKHLIHPPAAFISPAYCRHIRLD